MILIAMEVLLLVIFGVCLVSLYFSREKPKGVIFLLLISYVGAIVIPAGFAGIPAAVMRITLFHYQQPSPGWWAFSVFFLVVMIGIIVGCGALCITAIKHRPAAVQPTRF